MELNTFICGNFYPNAFKWIFRFISAYNYKIFDDNIFPNKSQIGIEKFRNTMRKIF